MASQATAMLGRKRWEGTTKQQRFAQGLAMSAAKQRDKTKKHISAHARAAANARWKPGEGSGTDQRQEVGKSGSQEGKREA